MQANIQNREIKSSTLYSRSLLTRNILLPITAIGKNLRETLERNLIAQYEGKCVVEGFIRPGSSKIITYSSGLIIRGNQVSFEIVFECDVCFPVEGMLISCVAKNITKAGIRAESAFDKPSPIVVFVARDHHYNDTYFGEVQEGDNIDIRVIGQRFELNDAYISIIAELVKPNKILETGFQKTATKEKTKKPRLKILG